jgi:hypothetical protein
MRYICIESLPYHLIKGEVYEIEDRGNPDELYIEKYCEDRGHCMNRGWRDTNSQIYLKLIFLKVPKNIKVI